jgi:hypothetical protein
MSRKAARLTRSPPPNFHAATATPLLVGLVTRRGFLVVQVLKGDQQVLWAP